VRYARCGAPKQAWPSFEGNSEVITGELIDTETVTLSSEGGRWKSAQRGNSLAAYLTARRVRREVCGNVPMTSLDTPNGLAANRPLPEMR